MQMRIYEKLEQVNNPNIESCSLVRVILKFSFAFEKTPRISHTLQASSRPIPGIRKRSMLLFLLMKQTKV